jgi:AhpC/TSA family protein
MPAIEPGQKVPAFSLKDQDGRAHSLKEFAGQPLILYFYPKDDTPGCTKEACAFRDRLPDFARSRAAVLSVSVLDVASKDLHGRGADDLPDRAGRQGGPALGRGQGRRPRQGRGIEAVRAL